MLAGVKAAQLREDIERLNEESRKKQGFWSRLFGS